MKKWAARKVTHEWSPTHDSDRVFPGQWLQGHGSHLGRSQLTPNVYVRFCACKWNLSFEGTGDNSSRPDAASASATLSVKLACDHHSTCGQRPPSKKNSLLLPQRRQDVLLTRSGGKVRKPRQGALPPSSAAQHPSSGSRHHPPHDNRRMRHPRLKTQGNPRPAVSAP